MERMGCLHGSKSFMRPPLAAGTCASPDNPYTGLCASFELARGVLTSPTIHEEWPPCRAAGGLQTGFVAGPSIAGPCGFVPPFVVRGIVSKKKLYVKQFIAKKIHNKPKCFPFKRHFSALKGHAEEKKMEARNTVRHGSAARGKIAVKLNVEAGGNGPCAKEILSRGSRPV